ncbi:TipJ family phage tail tip protein [Nitratidesulfovibrio oxamicus]|nr:phage tail protein [Nitratidesulfovibrio oxamicus]
MERLTPANNAVPFFPPAMKMRADDVLLVLHRNCLDLTQVVSEWVEWRPGLTIADILDARWPEGMLIDEGLDLLFSVSGRLLSFEEAERYIVRPGDGLSVALVPGDGGGGGSNAIAVVSMMAVMIAAPYLGGTMVSGALGMLSAETAIGLAGSVSTLTTVAAAGIAIAGAAAVNAFIPSAKPSLGQGLGQNPMDNSPTYGFSAQANPMEPGRPVPVLQGEKRNFTPTKLTQHLSTSGDRRLWNGLFLISEGPVDEVFDVRIDGNKAGNYEGLEIDIRLGTEGQDVLPWFNDAITERTEGVTVKLSTDWHEVVLDGTGVRKLGFGVQCASGLGYANDKGGLDPVTVQVQFQHRLYGETAWVDLGTVSISGAKRAAIMRYYEFEVAEGRHEVRYRHPVAPPTGDRYISDTWLEYTHEIVPDDFRLPHCALLAIRALPTDKLNGSAPKVTCSAKRMTAMLPDGQGGAVSRDIGNMAWAALELITNTRWGAGEPVESIDVPSFAEAAEWCELKGLKGSMYWDTQCTLETALGYQGQFGRFIVDRVGTKIVCISDRPVALPDAAFLATSADILQGTLGLEYPNSDDLADGCEITWFDPERGKQVVFAPGDFFNAVVDRPPTVAQITLYPCNSDEGAQRAGEYINRCNRYLSRRVDLTLLWRALGPHIRRGSVIQVAADRLMATQSGVVLSATETTVRLSRPVQLEPGTAYEVRLAHVDVAGDVEGVEKVEVRPLAPVAESTLAYTLTLAAPWEHVPSPGCSAAVGEVQRVTRWYRVRSLSRSSDMRVTLKALEYDEAVYADEGVAPQTDSAANLPAVVGLVATIIDANEDLVSKKLISLAWRGTALEWRVFVRRLGADADEWVYLDKTPYPSFLARNIEVGHMYRFAVTHTGSVADGLTVDVDYQLNTPSGAIRPVTVIENGVEVPLYALVNGEPQQVMGVF